MKTLKVASGTPAYFKNLKTKKHHPGEQFRNSAPSVDRSCDQEVKPHLELQEVSFQFRPKLGDKYQ